MRYIHIAKGTNLYDWFIFPTIRFNDAAKDCKYLTIEWLKWYIGIAYGDGANN